MAEFWREVLTNKEHLGSDLQFVNVLEDSDIQQDMSQAAPMNGSWISPAFGVVYLEYVCKHFLTGKCPTPSQLRPFSRENSRETDR